MFDGSEGIIMQVQTDKVAVMWIDETRDHRLHYDIILDDGGPHNSTSPATIQEIKDSVESMLLAVDNEMSRWSVVDQKRDAHKLEKLVKYHGRILAGNMFDEQMQNYITSIPHEYNVLSIITKSKKHSNGTMLSGMSQWPWDAIYIEAMNEYHVESQPKEILSENYYLGERYLVTCTVRKKISVNDLHSVQLNVQNRIGIASTEAKAKADKLGYRHEGLEYVTIRQLEDVPDMVQDKDIIAIVCHSTESVTLKGTKSVSKPISYAVYITDDNKPVTESNCTGIKCKSGAMIILATCRAGSESISKSMARSANTTVLAPYVILPADMGFGVAEAMQKIMQNNKNISTLPETLQKWRNSEACVGVRMLFGLYGRWKTRLINEEHGDD
jgi:hypothetical protein